MHPRRHRDRRDKAFDAAGGRGTARLPGRREQPARPLECVYESGPPTSGWRRPYAKRAFTAQPLPSPSFLAATIGRKALQAGAELAGPHAPRRLDGGSARSLGRGGGTPCHLSCLHGEKAANLRRTKQKVMSFLLITSSRLRTPLPSGRRRPRLATRGAPRGDGERDSAHHSRFSRVGLPYGAPRERPQHRKDNLILLDIRGYDFRRFRSRTAFASFLGPGSGTERSSATRIRNAPSPRQRGATRELSRPGNVQFFAHFDSRIASR